MAEHNELNLDDKFHFVSLKSLDDRTEKRLARSHAVARGLENKRKLQQKLGLNFRGVSSKDDSGRNLSKRKRVQSLASPPLPLSTYASSASSASQMLAAESSKLQALLSQHKVQHATEPIFSVLDELVLQNFRSVFRKGLDDHAFLSAAMLTFAFAGTDGCIDRECLRYQGQALSSIRRRMDSPDMATTESTLGAILLLARVEVRIMLLSLEYRDKSNSTWGQYSSF
ncbi:hypothetical protein PENARI_c001G09696 [Penicillium arizonense]|uniref:Uncharacterized protein n=1 Tax=Penicillium arizonense TaxID=1835702 RepID=A0A1F5LYE7_PENAI|nr:hypothetical protein PENARI_c001G09696 [Penicillium arizonense]OGE58193.1 hypothetical protein PENARI_c001G09696 [Penicillium arizonense]